VDFIVALAAEVLSKLNAAKGAAGIFNAACLV
jgi:hypothetical protein